MPTVPEYQQHIQQAPISGVKRAEREPTATIAPGLASVGAMLNQRGVEMQEEDDAAQLTETFALASDQIRPIMQDDILQRRGSGSFSAYQDADKAHAGISKNARAGLRTDEQRTAFDGMWASHRAGNLNATSRHVATERRQWRTNAAKVGAQSALEDAAANYQNPGPHIKRGRSFIAANLQGQTPDVIREAEESFVSGAHAAVIDRMVVGNADAANEYYQIHKDEIDGVTQTRIDKLLEAEGLREKSQFESDRIMSTVQGREEQQAAARKLEGKLRDETLRRIKDRQSLSTANKAKIKYDLVEEAGMIILNGGTLDNFKPEHRAALGIPGMSGMRNYLNAREKGVQVSTNYGVYFKLQEMATNPKTADRFLGENLTRYIGSIVPDELKGLFALQRSMRKGSTKDLTIARSFKQILDDALREVKIKPTDDESGAFRLWVENDLKAHGITKGDPDWRGEVVKSADRALIEGQHREGGLFGWTDPDVRRFKAPESKFFVEFGDIPTVDREEIETYLINKGIPVTPGTILEQYKEYKWLQ